ncbi:F0F1-type ATP synthase assembly protein I [Paenibacillus phyllosphaerae]|uniref:F0F1-type ATP synthase assembly protein I n=1 Tax=Paenibacillus phyllosphaerae TaxID=274593 RepID=A0A7W5AXG9_9BACL|nr:AtpZ/AtpI family protein [Paenibacillus phyllosphaerae]MBB3110584.1 F0F1-type ATP synthase assembly protein I [Paenibacillus phyllosphaerae]
MKPKSSGDNPWRALALVGAMGFQVAICTLLGYLIANWVFGTTAWLIVGIFVGLAAGILASVWLIKKVLVDSDG